jgi:hypothetical protein
MASAHYDPSTTAGANQLDPVVGSPFILRLSDARWRSLGEQAGMELNGEWLEDISIELEAQFRRSSLQSRLFS